MTEPPSKPPEPVTGSGKESMSSPTVKADWEKLEHQHEVIQNKARRYVERLAQQKDFLEQHAGFLTALLESIADGLVVLDVDRNVVLYNPAAEALAGFDPSEYTWDQWTERAAIYQPDRTTPVPEEELPMYRAAKGLPTETTLYYRYPESPQGRWLRTNAAPVRDRSGNLLGGIAVFHDITESRLAEERIHNLYNNAPCGYHSVDESGTLVEINDTELSWLGYTREEVVGKLQFVNILTPESAKTYADHLRLVIAGQSVSEVGLNVICKDGTVMPVLWSSTPMIDEAGKFLMTRSVLFDITERTKLIQQRDALAAIITHDLKNHLIGENQLLGMLLQGEYGPISPGEEETLRLLQTGSARQLQMTQSLVEIYRYDVGSEILRFEDTDLIPLIQSCIDEVFPSVTASNLELKSKLAKQLQSISADPRALRHVFVNLLGNSVKFTPAGGSISVSAHDEADQVVVTIADSGEGIPEEELALLFTDVWGSRASHKPVGSTGLGLYLCRRILDVHGAMIHCSSNRGIGTTFTITLPASRRHSQTRANAADAGQQR